MQEQNPLAFTVKLEKKDLTAFNLGYRKRFYLIFAFVYFVLAAGTFLLVSDSESTVFKFVFATLLGVVVAGLAILFLHVVLRIQVARMFKSDLMMQYEQHYTLDGSGITVLTQSGDTRINWAELYRAAEYRHSLAFFVGRNRALIVPKQALDAQVRQGTQQVKQLVRASLPAGKIQFRR